MLYYATDCQTKHNVKMSLKTRRYRFFFFSLFQKFDVYSPEGSSLNCNVFVTKIKKNWSFTAENIQYKISEQCLRNRKQWTITLITYWKLYKIEQFENDPVFFIYVVELLACVPLSFLRFLAFCAWHIREKRWNFNGIIWIVAFAEVYESKW